MDDGIYRFRFSGRANTDAKAKQQQPSIKSASSSSTRSSATTSSSKADLTIREDHSAEQLDELAKKYKESMKVSEVKLSTKTRSTPGVKAPPAGTSKPKQQMPFKVSTTQVPAKPQPKPLATLAEKRQNMKQNLKKQPSLSAQSIEAFKRQSSKTQQEYADLLRTSKPRINLVVVGHVDAGKSTLVGHLLFRLGQVTRKEMHRNELDSQRSGKASFKYAWALDETTEERARGVTIDIAVTRFETDHRDISLLDTPGHVDFIPAVISGAAQADAALLVVDATRGEFETGFSSGGQTREHTFLVRSLGVKSLIVVINKMDNVDWDQNRFDDIVERLKPFLKQVGFNLQEDVQFIVCSGLTGENLTERRIDKLKRESSHPQLEGGGSHSDWNQMPSLLQAIDRMKPLERPVDRPTRVCVTDVFKGMSSGVFLGGKVCAGKIEAKQKLLLLPPNETCEVKQVETCETKDQKAFAGDIVTTTVVGVDMNKFYRGCMLCDPLIPCRVSNRIHGRIVMLNTANAILIKGTPVEVHINGFFESGVVKRLLSLLSKSTGELIQRKPRCVAKNASAIVSFRLSRVVCCELYEDNKDLGRFMVRCLGKTIAAGLITKIKEPRLPKSKSKFKSK